MQAIPMQHVSLDKLASEFTLAAKSDVLEPGLVRSIIADFAIERRITMDQLPPVLKALAEEASTRSKAAEPLSYTLDSLIHTLRPFMTYA